MKTQNEHDILYPAIFAARALNVSRVTVYRYMRSGKLKAVRKGRNYYVSYSEYVMFYYSHMTDRKWRENAVNIVRRMRADAMAGRLETQTRTPSGIFGTVEEG